MMSTFHLKKYGFPVHKIPELQIQALLEVPAKHDDDTTQI